MVTAIEKPDYPYVTLRQSYLNSAREFMRRAGEYAEAGNFEYADGCAAKASKKFRAANNFPVVW